MIITMSIKVEHDQKQMKGKAKIQAENTNLIVVKTKRKIQKEFRQMTAKMKTSAEAKMKIL